MRHSILHTAGNVFWAAKNDRRHAAPLLATYWRLKLQELVHARHGRDSVKQVQILDATVSFFDYYWLIEMYEEIFLRKNYYFECENARPVVIDVGSNIGLAILFFKKLFPGAKVLGFEPDPETFEVLTTNLRQNRLYDVCVLNEAVYDGTESVYLYGDPALPGSPQRSIRSERMTGVKRAVPATRLSRHVAETVDFLKIDVEGAEAVVIDELERSGKLALVHRMAIEYHHHLDSDEDSLSAVLTVLERNHFGYQLEARLGASLGSCERHYQNVLIHAYRKGQSSMSSSGP